MQRNEISVGSVEPGLTLPPLYKGTVGYSHLVRWCAAQRNWDKVHFCQDYARQVNKVPDVFINGALKLEFITQFLHKSFDGQCWVWRLDTQFPGLDFGQQRLEVNGIVTAVTELDPYSFIQIDVWINNLDQEAVTTRSQAVVVMAASSEPISNMLDVNRPEHLALPFNGEMKGEPIPDFVQRNFGKVYEQRESVFPVSHSRLALYADAVMGVDPTYFQSRQDHSAQALPLYPTHGIELLPDSRPMSEETLATGREASSEVGRLAPEILGLAPDRNFNGGARHEIHSLVKPGEYVCGRSKIVSAITRDDPDRGRLCHLETLNEYWEKEGRPLVTERQIITYGL